MWNVQCVVCHAELDSASHLESVFIRVHPLFIRVKNFRCEIPNRVRDDNIVVTVFLRYRRR